MRASSRLILCAVILCLSTSYSLCGSQNSTSSDKFTVVVHSGAGNYHRNKTTLDDEVLIKYGLQQGLKAAYLQFKAGKTRIDAVQAALEQFENYPLFNAGVGSKIDEAFEIEMDASIMDGKDLSCGAVGGVKHIMNPIQGARLVKEKTKHILLVGSEADAFALKNGLTCQDNSYFFTEKRIEEWYKEKKKPSKHRTGTTGCVVSDSEGNVAAGTSTGGLVMKMAGRVGDSPLIGSGNYANSLSAAVSCTGTGEIFIRNVVGHDVHARMVYKGDTLKQAATDIINSLPEKAGGFIAVDKEGNVEMPYNSGGLSRGYVREDGIAHIYIFREGEDLTPTEYDLNNENIKLS